MHCGKGVVGDGEGTGGICPALGRQAVSRRENKSIEERLNNLTFGYESEPRICDRVRWICPRGHVVNAVEGSPCSMMCPTCRVHGCPFAGGAATGFSLRFFQQIAIERGGWCLSLKYENIKGRLKWRCGKGHEWEASAESVHRGSWCRQCSNNHKRLTIEDMRDTARKLGGECLSTIYVNGKQKLTWRCSRGHVFDMAPNNIRRSPQSARKPSWCPTCRQISSHAAEQQSRIQKATSEAFHLP